MAQKNTQSCCSVLNRVQLFATLQSVARRLPSLSEYSERVILYKDMEVLQIQKQSPFNSDSFVRTASLQVRSLNVCVLTYNTETSPFSLVIVMVCVYSSEVKQASSVVGWFSCALPTREVSVWPSPSMCTLCVGKPQFYSTPPRTLSWLLEVQMQSLKILFHPKRFHQKGITHRSKNRLPGKEHKL